MRSTTAARKVCKNLGTCVGIGPVRLSTGRRSLLGANIGELRINDSSGKIVVQSEGTTIDADGRGFRVLHVLESEVELKGLTITGGRLAFGFAFGGGILSEGSNLTLKNSQVTENMSIEGGGIANIDGTLVIMNSIVSRNRTEGTVIRTGNGGGIANFNSELTIINSELIENEAHNTGNEPDSIVGGVGAAIISVGTPDFSGSSWHSVTLMNSTVSANMANGRGGGIMLFSRDGYDGRLIVSNSSVSNNSAVDPSARQTARAGGF